MPQSLHRTFTACLQGADLRVARFEGREHLVAPVVLMVGDIIVTPITSGAPEFVPASVLAQAPAQWNGRPVTAGHPPSSANDPRTLEARQFGRVFNASFRDGKLTGEVWVDPTQAERVGPDAVSVLNRLRRGETVEISVGAWVTLQREPGTAGGQRFDFIWQHVAADHLAMLPPGQPGACSIRDGCGAGRLTAAQAQTRTSVGEVRAMIARMHWEDDVRRIRLAAILDPPPDGYSIALKQRQNRR